MHQTAHAQTHRSVRRIDDVKAPPPEETVANPAESAPAILPAAAMTAPHAPRRPTTQRPYGIITIAITMCMLLLALVWYAYQHSI